MDIFRSTFVKYLFRLKIRLKKQKDKSINSLIISNVKLQEAPINLIIPSRD